MKQIILQQELFSNRQRIFFLFAGWLMVFILFSIETMAQGNLLITPRRVIFEGSKRMQELNLANTGQDTATYVISFAEIRMNEDGTFENIIEPDSEQRFASDYLRFFPRTVTLGPNESQSVKLQLTKASLLSPGEYRSHIYFRATNDVKPLGENKSHGDSSDISVRLIPIFGITIPVIIRVGESTADVTISNLSLETTNDSTAKLNMTFNRTGNMSVYGDLKVEHISSQNSITQVAFARGLSVYTPNTLRRFHIELNKNKGINYNNGKLRVTYTMLVKDQPVKRVEAYCCNIIETAQ